MAPPCAGGGCGGEMEQTVIVGKLIIFANPNSMSSRGMFARMIFLLSVASAAAATNHLTIDVSGELLKHGGVVTIFHIPVGLEEWRANASDSTTTTVLIERRYAEIQLLYPKNGTFTYQFRAVPGSPSAEEHRTQVLSVIGTDMEGRGPQMMNGFLIFPHPFSRLASPVIARWLSSQIPHRSLGRILNQYDKAPAGE